MRLGVSYWILIMFSLLVFSGTAGAHPHELGNVDHGPSLDSYQIGPDFTTATKDWHDQNITLAKKNKGKKSDKSIKSKKTDKSNKSKKSIKSDKSDKSKKSKKHKKIKKSKKHKKEKKNNRHRGKGKKKGHKKR